MVATSLYRALTNALPLAGGRDIRQRPSSAELALEAEFAEALEEPLFTAYRYPFRNGVDDAPEDDDDLLAWLLLALGTAAAVRSLRATLRTYSRQAFNIGGQVALAEMGSNKTFSLQDAALIAAINAWADSLVDTGAAISLTRTTANELAIQIQNGRAAGLTNPELDTALGAYGRTRSVIRGAIIGETETVRQTRLGSSHTFYRNGVRRVVHRLGESETGPCEICEPLDGQIFEIIGGVVVGSDIPLHVNCVCYHEPVIDDDLPQEVWTGG